MTPTTAPAPATGRATTRSGSAGRLWTTGAGAGLSAAVATTGVAALARAIDVSLEVGGKAIPVIGFAELTFVASIIGTVIAVVLSRRADRPRPAFVVTTIALTFVSFVPDLLADAHVATKIALVLSHVVAAAIVIPALASRLSD
jgi:Family of unknown function (DUF6069)